MKTLAQRYQRIYQPLALIMFTAMLLSILLNDFTWPTMVTTGLLVIVILLRVVAARIAPLR